MVKIVEEKDAYYVIQWSQPEGDPARTGLYKNKKRIIPEEMRLTVARDSERDIDLTLTPSG
jgi:hypothetical protein